MRLAMIGLGKMGYNMTLRLLEGGHEVVAVDRNLEVARELADEGVDLRREHVDALEKLRRRASSGSWSPRQVDRRGHQGRGRVASRRAT